MRAWVTGRSLEAVCAACGSASPEGHDNEFTLPVVARVALVVGLVMALGGRVGSGWGCDGPAAGGAIQPEDE